MQTMKKLSIKTPTYPWHFSLPYYSKQSIFFCMTASVSLFSILNFHIILSVCDKHETCLEYLTTHPETLYSLCLMCCNNFNCHHRNDEKYILYQQGLKETSEMYVSLWSISINTKYNILNTKYQNLLLKLHRWTKSTFFFF